jgi:hypothetical protein
MSVGKNVLYVEEHVGRIVKIYSSSVIIMEVSESDAFIEEEEHPP